MTEKSYSARKQKGGKRGRVPGGGNQTPRANNVSRKGEDSKREKGLSAGGEIL